MLKTPWKKKKKKNQSRPPCNGQQMLFGKNWMAQREIESCRLNDLHTPICWEYRTVGLKRAREGAAFSLSLQISADKSILSLSRLTSYFHMTSLYQFKIFVLISLLIRWCHKKIRRQTAWDLFQPVGRLLPSRIFRCSYGPSVDSWLLSPLNMTNHHLLFDPFHGKNPPL